MSTMTCPTWATETVEPSPGTFGIHTRTVTVGDVTIEVDQVIDLDGDGSPEPVLANLSGIDVYADCDAQGCRDLAAALLEAARIIDNA
jgi:hypothetical protein